MTIADTTFEAELDEMMHQLVAAPLGTQLDRNGGPILWSDLADVINQVTDILNTPSFEPTDNNKRKLEHILRREMKRIGVFSSTDRSIAKRFALIAMSRIIMDVEWRQADLAEQ